MGMAQRFLLVLWFGWWVTSRSPRLGPAFDAASRRCYDLPSIHRLRRVLHRLYTARTYTPLCAAFFSALSVLCSSCLRCLCCQVSHAQQHGVVLSAVACENLDVGILRRRCNSSSHMTERCGFARPRLFMVAGPSPVGVSLAELT